MFTETVDYRFFSLVCTCARLHIPIPIPMVCDNQTCIVRVLITACPQQRFRRSVQHWLALELHSALWMCSFCSHMVVIGHWSSKVATNDVCFCISVFTYFKVVSQHMPLCLESFPMQLSQSKSWTFALCHFDTPWAAPKIHKTSRSFCILGLFLLRSRSWLIMHAPSCL